MQICTRKTSKNTKNIAERALSQTELALSQTERATDKSNNLVERAMDQSTRLVKVIEKVTGQSLLDEED